VIDPCRPSRAVVNFSAAKRFQLCSRVWLLAAQVSKRELLEWMNSVLNSSLSNVDKDVGDGAAYAQIFHAINKSTVKLDAVCARHAFRPWHSPC